MSDRTRPCKGCGGSGDTREHMPRGLEPLTREQWRDRVYCDAFRCPACLGSGRVTDVRTAVDAMVDAETLRNVHDAYSALSECWRAPVPTQPGFECCALVEASAWGTVCKVVLSNDHDFSGEAIEAARAAFRAIPGLREGE